MGSAQVGNIPVMKMNPPQKFGDVLVDFVEGENVLPVEQQICPPTPEGDVGNPNLGVRGQVS